MLWNRSRKTYWTWLTVALGIVSVFGLAGGYSWLRLPQSHIREYLVPTIWLALLLAPIFKKIQFSGSGLSLETPEDLWQVKEHAVPRCARTSSLMYHLFWLGNDLASLRFQLLVENIVPEERRELLLWQGKQISSHLANFAQQLKRVPLMDALRDMKDWPWETFNRITGEMAKDMSADERHELAKEILKAQYVLASAFQLIRIQGEVLEPKPAE